MFEINSALIEKMGWTKTEKGDLWRVGSYHSNNPHTNILIDLGLFADDYEVEYFISFPSKKKIFVIKYCKNGKPNQRGYKFISVDYSIYIDDRDPSKVKFVTRSFDSNLELLYLIRQFLACSKDYQIYFQINSIIDKKNEERS